MPKQPLLRRESWRDGLEIRWFNAGGGPQQDGEDPHFAYGREQVYPGGMFEHHLGRHVRESGYPGELLGSWVLELDDNWRPYYTGSIDVLPSATITGTVPAKTISVDAQTGEIKVYDLEDTPQWIDRIYSADTVKMILNWWGVPGF